MQGGWCTSDGVTRGAVVLARMYVRVSLIIWPGVFAGQAFSNVVVTESFARSKKKIIQKVQEVHK